MKITYSTDTISAFGGLNFVNNFLEKADIFNFICIFLLFRLLTIITSRYVYIKYLYYIAFFKSVLVKRSASILKK